MNKLKPGEARLIRVEKDVWILECVRKWRTDLSRYTIGDGFGIRQAAERLAEALEVTIVQEVQR